MENANSYLFGKRPMLTPQGEADFRAMSDEEKRHTMRTVAQLIGIVEGKENVGLTSVLKAMREEYSTIYNENGTTNP